MKNIRLYLSLSLLTIGFASCKRDADLATPDKKIVVSAQISPTDDTIRVIVEYSIPINSITKGPDYTVRSYDSNNEFVNAEVTLTDGTTSTKLKRNATYGLFQVAQTDYRLIPGKTYQLTVKDGRGREVSAQTSIPYAVTNVQHILVNEQTIDTYTQKITNRFSFIDALNKQHLYRLYSGAKTKLYPTERLYGNSLTEDKSASTGTTDIVVESNVQTFLYNGDEVTARSGYFISCSNEYFQFYKSLESIKGYSNTPELLEEPLNIYTNIKGGLGIFGGYNVVRTAD